MIRQRTHSQPDIRFEDIRAWNGKQNEGFEELCFQLLPWLVNEPLVGRVRVEGRGGDGGVEVIATTTSGLEVGLQCKLFYRLTQSQWSQIEDSVTTSIAKHPELRRYL